jgi:hypothetical protein
MHTPEGEADANIFSNDKADAEVVYLSNGSKDALLYMLVSTASARAATRWAREAAAWIASRYQGVYGLGLVGFNIDEIAWRVDDVPAQKVFTLQEAKELVDSLDSLP